MDDRRLMRMQIVKRVEQLVRPEHHPAQRERLSGVLAAFIEVVTRDVFHHEKLAVRFDKMIDHLWQHRMTQPRKYLCLALERAAHRFMVLKEGAFKCNRAAQPLVDGKVNLAHPAFTDQMDDQVTILDQRIGSKWFHTTLFY